MSCVNVKVKYIRATNPGYNNLKEWCSDANNIYIGRGGVVFVDGKRYPPGDSPWANPYKIGKDGNREQVIEKYEKYIRAEIKQGEVDLNELRGKTLGCWCAPEACHGDVLLRLLEA